jgi:aspartyl-tRNA(Asn)/glutamyl-tRNA(Gln) amidotransferase subunit B
MGFESVIGLEVHVQLNTRTKLFCACPAAYGAAPNSLTCPVCTGQPGVLPVLNAKALDLAVTAALALNSTVAAHTAFARKHYFYPDLPKGYQISQYDRPVATSGFLDVEGRCIGIERIHLEEDAGKTVLRQGERLVDLNRAGVPLLEIVTEPSIPSPAAARAFLNLLKRVLMFIEISECDMEKGSLRCDANLSLRATGSEALGVKTEVKNLNSFRHVEAALAHEERRQQGILEAGGRVVQETRRWNEKESRTEVMRTKEETHDYRYFPEPDLPGFTVARERVQALGRSLPELPPARMRRFQEEYGLTGEEAAVLTSERGLADYFEACTAAGGAPSDAAAWIRTTLLGALNERGVGIHGLKLSPERLAEVMRLVSEGRLSRLAAGKVITELIDHGGEPLAVMQALDLEQVDDEDALLELVREVISKHAGMVKDYRSGKRAALNALVGQVMKASGGKSHPVKVRRLLEEAL